MKPPSVADFPELRRAFSGYLHEDFGEIHETPGAALRAFMDDANPSERRRFVREVKRFLDKTTGLDHQEISALVTRLGSRWAPPSREALVALLVGLTKPHV